jgi:drug/metabolite transporter (DMT)-like permease
LLLGVANGGVVWAEQWVPSGIASLMVATSPFWVIAVERFRKDGERVGARGFVGLLIGFAGLAVLLAPKFFDASVSVFFLLGALALQIGCFAWTAGSAYAKRCPVGVSPLMGAAVQMLIAGAALTLIGAFAGEWSAMRFSARSTGALLYLVVFGSIVAYSAYTYALQKLPLSLVSTYSYINPVIAVLLGWLVLSEPLDWRVGVATGAILLGVALVKSSPKDVALLVERWRQWRARDDERSRLGETADETLAGRAACKQA